MMTRPRPSLSHASAPIAAWLIACLAAASPAFCAELELAVGAAYGMDSGAALEARASAAAEALGPVLAARISGSAAAALGLLPAEPSGEAKMAAEISASAGPALALASLEGGYATGVAFDAEGEGIWSIASALALSLNGPLASGSLVPRLAWRSGEAGRTELGGRLEISASAGALVLKPRADASWTAWADGSESVQVLPSLGLSWYPGFPVSLSADAGFRRSWLPSGATLDEIPCGLSCYAAIGDLLFFDIGAYALIGLADGALDEAGASGKLSIILGRLAGGEARLPIGLSWESGAPEGLEIRAGFELFLD